MTTSALKHIAVLPSASRALAILPFATLALGTAASKLHVHNIKASQSYASSNKRV
eukprot:CAMPEP_0172766686 /NCGR_PEP_ID=MMETSP1074-20121228/181646_1 /TAXON_ID=2916 /ORGANISM="Ceratium fusus, Strain PA161109" /LENGTH=54 /DNA_ID=CAMNT_0013601827 /DNA_START=285 /DNA_END=449 /DNA_ORIENTATION=+